MNIKENVGMKGKLIIFKKDENNNLIKVLEKDNLIVTSGFNYIADLMAALPVGNMTHIGVGSSSTAPSVGQTTLVTQLFRKIFFNRDGDNNIFRIESQFNPGEGTGTWREAGIFNNAVGGTMLNRVTFADFSKLATETVIIRFEVSFI